MLVDATSVPQLAVITVLYGRLLTDFSQWLVYPHFFREFHVFYKLKNCGDYGLLVAWNRSFEAERLYDR